MPSPLKKVHTATFDGGIVTTIAPDLRQPNTAEYILNCDILSSGEGNVGIITNQKGNKLVETSLPDGECKTIGIALDEENNRFYFAVWNENGYHTWYQYDSVEKKVSIVMQSITDTGGVDILRWDKKYKILHADVVRNNLLYWVDGFNNARKINIEKAKDKSIKGYGPVILEEYIDAYKHAPKFSPTPVAYATDTTVSFNRLYGNLYKFASRFIYDDGEKSNYSDYSIVPIPDAEYFTGINSIPINNNVINISVETGSRIVVRIEIAMLRTNPEGGFYSWKSIALLDKEKLGIPDNSSYVYKFYNDSRYDDTEQDKIVRPYSFMPKIPLCQSFVGNSMVYANGYEGFGIVPIDITSSVAYNDLFIASNVVNQYNSPIFNSTTGAPDYYGATNSALDANGNPQLITDVPVRFNVHTLTVGFDVKKGNIFTLRILNGDSIDISISYTATISDTADTIVSILRNWLLGTGRIYRETEDIGNTNIFDSVIDGGGNITFSYIFKSDRKKDYAGPQTSVNPVQFSTLKDDGVSVKNIKMGFPVKFGIEYEDYDGRKSLVYTDDSLIINIASINEKLGVKAPVVTLNINHKPPIWARYYQIVRANYYDRFIQFLIQKVLTVASTTTTNTLDLIVGSLYTYQKVHPNSTLKYQFTKGDRVRFLYKINVDHSKTYYDFYETEIIQYQESTTETINSNVTVAGTTTVTVAASDANNIGKYISIDGNLREIIARPSSTTYTLDNPIGGSTTYLTYDLIDYRSSIRIRKPDPSVISIGDFSVVEVYSPTSANEDGTSFYEFSKKFQINDYGTENATHGGNVQQQTDSLPAIVSISDGDVYVRSREFPVNNIFPGAQVEIGTVEDPSYSDFYESRINDNGRINKEDDGDGEVHFGSRFRYSNNFIEDTRINGLNDFDNLDREDYNDQYGDVKLIKFDENRIFTFKELKDCWIPVRNVLTQDNNGASLLVGSAKLLNPIQYFVWNGGIGNNPESYARNGNQHYHVSANSGVVIRLGGSGVIPISAIYQLDNVVRAYLSEASKNGADIYGGFNRKKDNYLFSISDYQNFVFNTNFDQATWVLDKDTIPSGTVFEIVSSPSHGSLSVSGDFITYTPTTDYVGSDTFSYRIFKDGVWSDPINDCIDIVEIAQPTAWRPKESSYFCVTESGDQTGYKGWTTLEQYYIFSGVATGVEKPNSETDTDYNAPVYDATACLPSPDAFSFIDVADADLSTLYTSNTITISGLVVGTSITVSITGGTYRKNSGLYTSADGVASNGDTFQVRQTSSASYSTTTSTVFTAGGYSDSFDVTTENPGSPLTVKYSVGPGVCAASSHTVYISNVYTDIDTGVVVYTDALLINELVGALFIVNISTGIIYDIDSSSGEVLSPTGGTC